MADTYAHAASLSLSLSVTRFATLTLALTHSPRSLSHTHTHTHNRIVIFPHLIVTFHSIPAVSIQGTHAALRSVARPSFLVYHLLDGVIDSYIAPVNASCLEVFALDDVMLEIGASEADEYIDKMRSSRKRILFLQQKLWPKRDILETLIKKRSVLLRAVQVHQLRDVYDRVATMLEQLEVAQNMLASLQDTYLNKVNVDVTSISYRINAQLFRLTLIATILMPMNIITSMFGMNVHIPGQSGTIPSWQDDYLVWFIGIIVSLALLGAGMRYYFRRQLRLAQEGG